MTVQKFDIIDAPANRLGECPIWCEQTSTLWWVDVLTPALMSYVPQTGQVQQHKVEARRIGSLALREKGGLVLACDNGLFAFDPESGAQTFLVDPEPGVEGHRKNDGRADWAGNFWIGTLREADYAPVGALYRVKPDHSISREAADLAIPNGLAFDADRKRMYFADTRTYTIWMRDYDPVQDRLGQPQIFARTTAPERPDGSCIDEEGFVWSAIYAGGKLIRFDPHGTIDRVIELPVSHPTCCCFGGESLDTLFVTSAVEPLGPEERALEPLAGKVLAFKPGIRGRAEFKTWL